LELELEEKTEELKYLQGQLEKCEVYASPESVIRRYKVYSIIENIMVKMPADPLLSIKSKSSTKCECRVI